MKRQYLLSSLLSLLISLSTYAQTATNTLQWSEIAPLPPGKSYAQQKGLASPFAGSTEGAVIVAGGCNFPDKPVRDGGNKVFHKDIFVLPPTARKWITAGALPEGMAYGASVSIPDGLLCIGGNNADGISNKSFVLAWHNQRIEQTDYPDLPFPLTLCSAAVYNNVVYLAGSRTSDRNANFFFRLNLNNKGKAGFQWEILPDFPGAIRNNPIVVVQSGKVYLLGGFTPSTESLPAKTSETGLAYNPETSSWKETSKVSLDGNTTIALQGASALPIADDRILVIGGVNRELFEDAVHQEYIGAKAHTKEEKERFAAWKKAYYSHDVQWYRFNREILIYHTKTNTWSCVGIYPFPPPAGAAIVPYADGWLVINGEMCPGIRSEKVYYGFMKNKDKLKRK